MNEKTIDKKFQKIAFKALSKMKVPDFSLYDGNLVADSFRRLYYREIDSESICNSVNKKGKAYMEKTSFYAEILGPSFQYLLTTNHSKKGKSKTQKVVFTYSRNPFVFNK